MGTSQLEAAQQASISKFYSSTAWVEGRAEEQLDQVAGWCGISAVAAFPDLHPGRFGPVGAAFLADRLYPQLIGPDIGCGMALFRLDMPRRKLKLDKAARRLAVLDEALDETGLGTIGGGNHFCEVQAVAEIHTPATGFAPDDLCLLVHTGSRGMGAAIFTGIEDSWRDGFAPESAEGQAYLDLHDRAVAWAKRNRLAIAERVAAALRVDYTLICDAPHNLVTPHAEGWLHRKGAAAPEGGLAPLAGSREDLSFLLSVPENPEALGSVSHGSGRRYDRHSMHGRVSRKRSDLDAMKRNKFGGMVICENRDLLVEEAGKAYKDATTVLEDLQTFRVAEPILSLTPLLTFKTTGGRG